MASRLETVTSALLGEYTPMALAAHLDINNTHVYRARRGDFTDTFVDALCAKGHLVKYQRPKYFQIRRDDPKRAARQIMRTLGEEYAHQLGVQLLLQNTRMLRRVATGALRASVKPITIQLRTDQPGEPEIGNKKSD